MTSSSTASVSYLHAFITVAILSSTSVYHFIQRDGLVTAGRGGCKFINDLPINTRPRNLRRFSHTFSASTSSRARAIKSLILSTSSLTCFSSVYGLPIATRTHSSPPTIVVVNMIE